MLLQLEVGKNRSDNIRYESVVVFQTMDDAVIDECCTLQYSNFMCLFST